MGKILSLAIMVCLSTNLFSQVQDQPTGWKIGTWDSKDIPSEVQPDSVQGTWDKDRDSLVGTGVIDPSAQDMKTAYTSLEPQLLADIDWLNYTPLDKNQNLRVEKSRFVLMWMSGTPTVKIDIDDRILTFLKADSSLLLAYMMGWTKYSIEHNYSTDAVECTAAAITTVTGFYERNSKILPKSKEIDQYAKMVKDNSLRSYIKGILSK